MLKATAILPAEYKLQGTFDLSKNRLAALGMTLAAVGVLLPVTWLLLQFLAFARPEVSSFEFEFGGFEVLLPLAALAALTAIVVLAHEALHGLGFWAFTGQRPVFGLRGLYAFAGAPTWYIPRGQYLLVGLAPLVVITVAGLGLLLVIPSPAVMAVVFVVAFNAAGAVGDLAAVAWLLAQPPATLVRDTGDAITVFQPASAEHGKRA